MIGGKHFRPTLTLLSNDIIGGDRNEAITWSLIPEMIHCSSLIHDDIIDNDTVRRGKDSLHVAIDKIIGIAKKIKNVRNIPIAVLSGDVLLAKAYSLIHKIIHDESQYNAFIDVSNTLYYMLIGVINESYIDRSPTDYYKIIKYKTGKLFGLSCKMAEYSSLKYNTQLYELGEQMGILYQMVDDLSDGDLPKFITKNDISKQYTKVINIIDGLEGNNKYIKLLRDVPRLMCEKLYGGDISKVITCLKD